MVERGRGVREEFGEVKLHILLYIASHGHAKFEDIRTSIYEKYKIKSTRGIRNHLEDLQKEGLLNSEKNWLSEKKHINLYTLPWDFDAFKRLFNYFKKYKRVNELMDTKYYSNYIESDDFNNKYLAYILKENAHIVDEYLRTSGKKEQVLNDYEKLMLKVDEIIRSSGRDPQNRLVEMLKVSPSAIDFVLNPEYKNRLILSYLANFFKNVFSMDIPILKIYKGPEAVRELIYFSPIFDIIKALFLVDLVEGKIIKAETNERILSSIIAGGFIAKYV